MFSNVKPPSNLDEDCVFCQKILDGSAESMEPYHHCYIFEPLNPVVEGHRLIIPGRHLERDFDRLAIWVGMAFTEAARYGQARGVDHNLIMSLGGAASQTIEHVHTHYVPRTDGDDLRLPWTP